MFSSFDSVIVRLAGRRLAGVMLMIGMLGAGGCTASVPTRFDTPEAAAEALVSAMRPAIDCARMQQVLGPDIGDAAPSCGEVADEQAVEEFLMRYDRGHRFVNRADGSKILEVDTDPWPFAFPLVQSNGKWHFDTAAGLEELEDRRVGDNELSTIQTCLAIVDAQREYASLDTDGDGLQEYAQKFISDDGKRNGLYWPTSEDESPSPLGELVALASQEGYARGGDACHGYRFKLLTGQGAGAPGGEMDYMVKDELLGGFGVLAWPAVYGRSGVKTFITNHDGVVYEKDLGDDTDAAAQAIEVFDPAGWAESASAAGN